MADFEDAKRRIKQILSNHRGIDNPIARDVLVREIGLADRLVRDLIAEIRQEEKIPLINLGAGYFQCITSKEIEYGIDKSYSYLTSFQADITALKEAKKKLCGEQVEFAWDIGKRQIAEWRAAMVGRE